MVVDSQFNFRVFKREWLCRHRLVSKIARQTLGSFDGVVRDFMLSPAARVWESGQVLIGLEKAANNERCAGGRRRAASG